MVVRSTVSRSELRDDDLRSGSLCLETQGRDVMAKLVHDVVAEAMRLDLYGAPKHVEKVNGERFRRSRNKVRHG
jgi:hypothetical protein